jgi:collagenase-like PrtC family protease
LNFIGTCRKNNTELNLNLIKYNTMWNVAGAVNDTKIRDILIRLNEIKPNLITSTFDCYEPLIWQGGRAFQGIPKITAEEFIDRVKVLNKNNIGVYYTFNNLFVKEEHLDDKWGNYFLKESCNKLNGVVCGSGVLAKYIRKKYPGLKLIGSCSIMEHKADHLKKLQELYDILVLPNDLNNSHDIIGQLDASRLEVLVSLACIPDCQMKKYHYALNSKWNINRNMEDLIAIQEFQTNENACWNRRKKEKKLGSTAMTKKQIDKLKELGVKFFKIQERGHYHTTILNLFRYVIWFSNEPWHIKYKMFRCLPQKFIITYYLFYHRRQLKKMSI